MCSSFVALFPWQDGAQLASESPHQMKSSKQLDLLIVICLFDVSEVSGAQYSVDPVSSASEVYGSESGTCALVENRFGFEALVFVVVVGTHARSEGGKVSRAELLQDVLARGAIVFSGEAI